MISKVFIQDTLLQLLLFLDMNFANLKVFDSLAILVKILLTQWETEKENHRYKKLGKLPSNLKKEIWKEKQYTVIR